jgi:hypothetical protein
MTLNLVLMLISSGWSLTRPFDSSRCYLDRPGWGHVPLDTYISYEVQSSPLFKSRFNSRIPSGMVPEYVYEPSDQGKEILKGYYLGSDVTV